MHCFSKYFAASAAPHRHSNVSRPSATSNPVLLVALSSRNAVLTLLPRGLKSGCSSGPLLLITESPVLIPAPTRSDEGRENCCCKPVVHFWIFRSVSSMLQICS